MPAKLLADRGNVGEDAAKELSALVHKANLLMRDLVNGGFAVLVKVCNTRSVCSDGFAPKVDVRVLGEGLAC